MAASRIAFTKKTWDLSVIVLVGFTGEYREDRCRHDDDGATVQRRSEATRPLMSSASKSWKGCFAPHHHGVHHPVMHNDIIKGSSHVVTP